MKHLLYSFLFLVIIPNALAQTQTIKVMSGVQNEGGFKLIVAEVSPKSKVLEIVKVIEIEKYGNHEHFKIPKTDKVFVIAVPISENVKEGMEIPQNLSAEVQTLGVEGMRSFNLTITQSEDEVFHYTLTNVHWGHRD
ncbi:MAG: hypothetical protein ACI85I_000581 [Arenicella sp.]|jgi:hypothetical protein